jgi:RHS repeat-associated protein
MATGSWVRVLDNVGSITNETSYIVYDTRYRPIRSYTKNYLGGYTQVDSQLDWSGKTIFTVTSHDRTVSGLLLTIHEKFTYTEQDRLVKHIHKIIGASTEQLLTSNTYDELGQLTSKKVGGTDDSGAQALQNINYSYNIRGWLTAINDVNNLTPSATDRDLFAFKINYNKKENDTPGLFNGNISETLWRTSADNVKRKYAYNYDNLNRLLEANYSKPEAPNTLDNYLEKLSYDQAGNILTLERNGNLDPSGGAPVNQIDNLEYSYHQENKNQLLKVRDLSNSPQGFKDNLDSTENDFSYDANGNMKLDNNKGITAIIYNHLNLPTKIVFSGTTNGEISYLYNAIGGKVKKVVEDNVAHTTTTTDYLSGFQYLNTELQFFPHAEGYVHYTKPLAAQGGENSALGSFNYVFNYTDHLGNVRLSYARDPLVGNRVKILEENHYYAFGLKHKNYNVEKLNFEKFPDTGVELVPMPAVANSSYNYKYNGKELQEELGLNMTAMDWRQYDSAIGRFVVIDLMAEQAHDLSPYRFGFNSPTLFSDPTGLWEEIAGGYTTNDSEDIAQFMSALSRNNNKKDNKKKLDIFITGNTKKGDILEDNKNEAVKTEKVLTELFGYSTLRTVSLTEKNSVSELENTLSGLSGEGYGFNSFIISSHGSYDDPSFKIGNESITSTNYNKTKGLKDYFKGSSVFILACHVGGGNNLTTSSAFVQGLSNLWGATVYANRSWGIPLNFGGAMHTNSFDAWQENRFGDHKKARGNAEIYNGQFLRASPGNKTPTIINNLRLHRPTEPQKNINSTND